MSLEVRKVHPTSILEAQRIGRKPEFIKDSYFFGSGIDSIVINGKPTAYSDKDICVENPRTMVIGDLVSKQTGKILSKDAFISGFMPEELKSAKSISVIV